MVACPVLVASKVMLLSLRMACSRMRQVSCRTQLKFEADQQFFERGLDGVDVVVHGRHSHEQQPHSHLRRRLILTRQVPAIAADPSNEKALFWNPAGASFEEALAAARDARWQRWRHRRYGRVRDVPGPL